MECDFGSNIFLANHTLHPGDWRLIDIIEFQPKKILPRDMQLKAMFEILGTLKNYLLEVSMF